MWVHVVIFVMILCALTGWKKGWIPSSGIGGKDGIRLFAVVAIAGNLLGMILTLQNGGQVYPQGYRLEKEDTGSYEKEFMVSVDGEEPVSMYIQVPEKELEEQEEPKQDKKLTREEQAQKDLAGALICGGIMGHLAIQVILNIAVVTNTIPNTGITLPFVSYGGTSVVFLLGEMGLALSVSNSQRLR